MAGNGNYYYFFFPNCEMLDIIIPNFPKGQDMVKLVKLNHSIFSIAIKPEDMREPNKLMIIQISIDIHQ